MIRTQKEPCFTSKEYFCDSTPPFFFIYLSFSFIWTDELSADYFHGLGAVFKQGKERNQLWSLLQPGGELHGTMPMSILKLGLTFFF